MADQQSQSRSDAEAPRMFPICKDHKNADWNQPQLEDHDCILCRLFYLEAQETLLEKWQQRAKRAEDTIAEVQRPLDAQMARLNETVTRLNNENEQLRKAVSERPAASRNSIEKPPCPKCEAIGPCEDRLCPYPKSDTPITDLAEHWAGSEKVVRAGIASDLERKLAAAVSERGQLDDERIHRIACAYFGDPRHASYCGDAIRKALREHDQEVKDALARYVHQYGTHLLSAERNER